MVNSLPLWGSHMNGFTKSEPHWGLVGLGLGITGPITLFQMPYLTHAANISRACPHLQKQISPSKHDPEQHTAKGTIMNNAGNK